MTNYKGYGDEKQLLHDIGMVDFAVIDLTLFLDTHPYDQEALAKWNYYQHLKNQLVREYTMKYGPLRLDDAGECKEWNWALKQQPWERGF